MNSYSVNQTIRRLGAQALRDIVCALYCLLFTTHFSLLTDLLNSIRQFPGFILLYFIHKADADGDVVLETEEVPNGAEWHAFELFQERQALCVIAGFFQRFHLFERFQ